MKFRYVVTVDSPCAPPDDRAVWASLLKGVSKDQSRVFIVVQPVQKCWFTLLGGGPQITFSADDSKPYSFVPYAAVVRSVIDLAAAEPPKCARGGIRWGSRNFLGAPLDIVVATFCSFVLGYLFAMLVKTLAS